MFTKEKLKNLLSSECVNCSCRINRRKQKVSKASTYGTNLKGNQTIVEALSFIYKISLKNLVSNIQSYFTSMLDDPLEQSDELIEIFANSFAFCGKCDALFQEVHSAHKSFYEYSAVDNLLSKAIQHQNIEDTIIQPECADNVSTTDDNVSEMKSENDDEINLFSGEEETCKNDCSEAQNSCMSSDEIKIDLDQTEFEESENNPDPLLDLEHHEYTIPKTKSSVVSNKIVPDLIEYPEDDTILNGPPFVCPICNDSYAAVHELKLHCKDIHRVLIPYDSSSSSNESEAEITDDLITEDIEEFTTYNYSRVDGPPFYCPMCNRSCQSQNGYIHHCKTLHQLLIPEGKIRYRNPKSVDSTKRTTFHCKICYFTTSSSIDLLSNSTTFLCPMCIQITTHDSVINGHPFQCPKCNKSFLNLSGLTTHCKFRHLLLLPVPTSVKKRKSKLRNIICYKCKCVFKNSTGWKIHCRVQHRCDFFCDLCINCFATNDDLVKHLKTSCKSIRCNSNDLLHNDCPKSNETELEEKSSNDVEMLKPKSSKDLTNQFDVSQLINENNSVKRLGKDLTKKPHPAKERLTTSEQCDSTPKIKKNRTEILYGCNECGKSFPPQENFKQHLKTVHYEKYVSCVRASSPAPAATKSDKVFEISSLNCTECDLTFKQYDLLQKHSVEIHSITLENYEQRFYNYVCRKCDRFFEIVTALSTHLGKCCDQSVKMFDCKFCTTRFNSSQKLLIHMKFVHDMNTPFVASEPEQKTNDLRCKVCLKVFESYRDLNYHTILSFDAKVNMSKSVKPAEENSFSCDICNKSFLRNQSLKSHIKVHLTKNSSGTNKNAEFICNVCNMTFSGVHGLKCHQSLFKHQEKEENKNSLQGSFNCDICKKSYARMDSLKKHIKIMHFRKKEKCEECHKQIDIADMSQHMRTHTGYNPYKCTFCHQRFPTSTSCKNHEASIHIGAHPFVCSVCGKGFTRRTKMKHHEETHSTHKLYTCERCGASLKTRRTYYIHMNKHKEDDLAGPNPKCSECNEVFSSGPKLRHHKLIKHNKNGPVPCPFCGKVFALKEYLYNHEKAMHRER